VSKAKAGVSSSSRLIVPSFLFFVGENCH